MNYVQPPLTTHFRMKLPTEKDYNCCGFCLHLTVLTENGGYSQWSAWTICSVACGVGSRSRRRTCTNPAPGPYGSDCSDLGSENQTAECNRGVVCPQLENYNKTAECDSDEDCNPLKNNNEAARCNKANCGGNKTFVILFPFYIVPSVSFQSHIVWFPCVLFLICQH